MVLNLNEIRGNAKRVRKGRREPSSSMSFSIKAVQVWKRHDGFPFESSGDMRCDTFFCPTNRLAYLSHEPM
jgi:hypothetical protein